MSANWHIWYTFYDHSSKHRPGTWIPLFWIEKCNMSVSNCWHICAEFLLDVCIVWGFPLEAFVPSVPWRQNRANVSSECLSSAPTPHPWMYLSKLQNVFVQITNSATTSFGYVSFCSDLFGWEMFVLNFQFLLMQFLNAMQFLRQSFLSALIRTLSGNHHALIL